MKTFDDSVDPRTQKTNRVKGLVQEQATRMPWGEGTPLGGQQSKDFSGLNLPSSEALDTRGVSSRTGFVILTG